jgi:hypothetical protein
MVSTRLSGLLMGQSRYETASVMHKTVREKAGRQA